jgi:bacterioferritin
MRGWRKESIEEMQHADKIIERIIFLDGAPNMQTLEALHIGQTVKQLAVAIALRSPICDDDANGALPGMAGS